MKSASVEPPRRRLAILSRVAAAVFGGYLLAAVCTVFLSHLFPGPVAEAVLAATLGSFAICTAAVVWAFAARSAGRAWLGLALPAAVLGAAAVALHFVRGSA